MPPQFDDRLDTLPTGAIPLRDAICCFAPDHIKQEFKRVWEARRELPRWQIHRSAWMVGEEAQWQNPSAQRWHLAKSDLNRAGQQILRAFFERLIAGSLIAIAQTDAPFGCWRVIPTSAWPNLQIKNIHDGRVIGPGVDLAGVHVIEGNPVQPCGSTEAAAPDQSLPLTTGADGRPLPTTGAPGRPSHMHLIEAEFDLRAEKGQIESSLASQGRVLHSWFLANHHGRQAPTPKTICNRLRPKFREAKSKQV